jgi:hypothetical protein
MVVLGGLVLYRRSDPGTLSVRIAMHNINAVLLELVTWWPLSPQVRPRSSNR